MTLSYSIFSLVPLDGPKVNAVSPMVRDQTGGEETVTTVALLNSTEKPEKEKKASPPPQHSISLEQPQVPNFDISDVIAIRLKAMRQLSENPKSDDAKKQLEDATQMVHKNDQTQETNFTCFIFFFLICFSDEKVG